MATNLRVADARPRLQMAPEQSNLPAVAGGFDLDAWHAMQARDEQLVAQRAAQGVAGKIFVYRLAISGQQQDGLSVEGAHQLACIYGGIKHRIVASVEKKGAVFTFKSYPAENVPMSVAVNVVQELAAEDDFYSVVVEVTDVKTGNSFQVEKSETRLERRRDGSMFERPNYQIIAQSKARRNGILTLIPGDVQEQFKARCLQAGQAIDISSDVFRAKREAVTAFAAAKGISIDRQAIAELTLEQIAGLGDAAREKDVAAFRAALEALGLASAERVEDEPQDGQKAGPKAQQKPAAQQTRAKAQDRPAAPKAQQPDDERTDPETGEVTRTGGLPFDEE